MEKMHYIYKIVNSKGEIIYIGRTTDLKRRFSQHKSRSKRTQKRTRGLYSLDLSQCQIEMIEEVDTLYEAKLREAWWILYYLTQTEEPLQNLEIAKIYLKNRS